MSLRFGRIRTFEVSIDPIATMSEDSLPAGASRKLSTDSRPKKRKRGEPSVEELEVDVNAPEPPSKKALRKAKKTKPLNPKTLPKPKSDNPGAHDSDAAVKLSETSTTAKDKPTTESLFRADKTTETAKPPSKRSDHGIWIGNLPWSTTNESLRQFLTTDTGISDEEVTRLHMPTTKDRKNKGYAYVDFATKEALKSALELSETLMMGRRVLIKDSKSFVGRPDKTKEDTKPEVVSGKPPSKRIFIGNLGFDITKEDIQHHFSRCGNILDVHLATFEDSGKCKGYGWVEFDTVEAGKVAVRGWVNIEQKQSDSDEEDERVDAADEAERPKLRKKSRARKGFVNKLQGRPMRMEFAEDKAIRYKKRFGKKAPAQDDAALEADEQASNTAPIVPPFPALQATRSTDKENSRKVPRERKFDARTIKPGAAHAAAPRLQGAVVPSQGKKTILV